MANKRGKYRPRKRIFTYVFQPLLYVSAYERDILERLFDAERARVPFFQPMHAWRRRGSWALQAPLGTFGTAFTVSLQEEAYAVEAAIQRSIKETGHQGFRRDKELRSMHGVVYFSRRALEALRPRARIPELVTALLRFLNAADEDPSLVTGETGWREVARPLAVRRQEDGTFKRGPSWKEWEVFVLRKWFSRRADGRHHKLTDKQWDNVLANELKGRRTKEMVKRQLVMLNHKLKRSLMVDGFINRDGVREYMAKALGERIQVPKFRPRLHGTYHKPASNGGNVVHQVDKGADQNVVHQVDKGADQNVVHQVDDANDVN